MKELLEKHATEMGLLIAGGVLVGVGIFIWKLDRSANETQVEILSQQVEGEATSSGKIIVDLAGEVVDPGVYEVQPGDRVGEVLILAGGLTQKADKEWVGKYLNQAERLKDGMKIFIPRVNDQLQITNYQSISNNTNSKMNINQATEEELDTLPGIGPVTAKKIISGRPYSRKEELVERKVITQKIWNGLQDLVEVW